MKNAKLNLTLFALSALTVVALAGSSMGTLAWYAYTVRVTVEYEGTAVNRTEQLQIGLLWDDVTEAQKSAFLTAAGFEQSEKNNIFQTIQVGEDPEETETYCFMPAGQGFTSDGMKVFLESQGYATNSLQPVTARKYQTGNELKDNQNRTLLYQAPSASYTETNILATKDQYVYAPFAFRVLEYSDGTNGGFAPNQNIWLTDVSTAIKNSRIADRALRVHVDNLSEQAGPTGSQKHFNLNPKAAANGTNYVAGLLDLKKTGYYDTNAAGKELIYGDLDTTVVQSDADMPATTTFLTDVAEADANVNNVTDDEKWGGYGEQAADTHTTFLAKHRAGTTGYTTFKNAADKDVRGLSQYVSLSGILPSKNSGTGDFEGGWPIAITDDDANAIGRCDMYIYLEGWDHSIVDSQIDSVFSLGLQFEINRV